MRRVHAVLGVAMVVGALAGCSTGVPPEVLQRWVGRPFTALEKDWGPATREVADGDLKILVYEEVERRSSRGQFETTPGTTSRRDAITETAAAAVEAYRVPTVYVRSYLFWVNRDGTIVNSMVRNP
jgi:hypothetical protein